MSIAICRKEGIKCAASLGTSLGLEAKATGTPMLGVGTFAADKEWDGSCSEPGLGVVSKEFFGSFFPSPASELPLLKTELQESSFRTASSCEPACLDVYLLAASLRSTNLRGHSVRKYQAAAALGVIEVF